MTQPTPSEIVLLHTRDQRTQLFLSIYQPKVVFSALINDVNIGVGQTVITFDTVSSGAYTGILAGMTLYVGSTPGDDNYGRIRVRSATATTIIVAANSDINWHDDLYLTVKDFYEVWPIRQTVQTVGNTPATDQVLVYKDSDIVYTNQNDHPGSLIWMGSHQAAWMENGLAQIYWSASGTVNTEDDSMTYAWAFEGGSPATSTFQTPGLVDYSTAGHYVTKLVVTSGNGVVDTSYRYVSIYDDAHQPIVDWGMDALKGTRKDGSYSTTLWVRQPVDAIVEGSLVVLFSKNYYGTTPYSFVNNIEFVGYILNDSISYDFQQSKVEFDVGSVTEVMKIGEIQGISLTSVSTPSNWSEIANLTVLKSIWWFLRWHSTILNLVDVRYTGLNLPLYAFEPDPASLYDALDGFMQTRLLGIASSNRQGQIICEPNPETIHHSPTVTPLGMRIDRQDWVGNISIKEATRPVVSYMEMGGYVYDNTASGTNTPYLSSAPGITPSYFGKVEEEQAVILMSGQYYLDTLVGDVFAYKNARFPETVIAFAGNYGNIEFIPSERYLLTVDAVDSQSRIVVNNLPIHPTELSWKYVPEKQFFSVEGTFHQLVEGHSGTWLEIPTATIPNTNPIPPFDPPPWIPGSGIPWSPPFIPPVFPGDTNCAKSGPFLLFPDRTTLDKDNNSAFCFSPCKIHQSTNVYDTSPHTKMTVYYATSDIGSLASVDAMGASQGTLATASFGGKVLGNNNEVYQVASGFFDPTVIYAQLSVQGFRINASILAEGPNRSYDIPLGDLIINGYSPIYTGYGGDISLSVTNTGYTLGGTGYPNFHEIQYKKVDGNWYAGGENSPINDMYNGTLQYHGGSLLGGDHGPFYLYGVVMHCEGIHYPSTVHIKRIYIENVC